MNPQSLCLKSDHPSHVGGTIELPRLGVAAENRIHLPARRGFLPQVSRLGETMATVFRKQVTRPIPAGAELFTKVVTDEATGEKSQVEFARWTVQKRRTNSKRFRQGDSSERVAEVIQNANGERRIKTLAGTYTVRYRDASGRPIEVSTGCHDRDAAMAKLRELEGKVERIRRGVLRPEEIETEDFQTIPLAQHIDDYIADLRARGVNADRIKTSKTYLDNDSQGSGFKRLRDLNAEKLRKWLRSDSGMSAATYNWHSALWSAFGAWLTGKRIESRRGSMTGERRISVNPFEGLGKKDENADRKRIARAMTLDEMTRLIEHARKRPLLDATLVRKGPRKGEHVAQVSDERRAELERLGLERSLIYKTAILTGLRLNELKTLCISDLSFGDVPFVCLKASNEKNRKGSTVPLKKDLAAELQAWTNGRRRDERVFNVPAGFLRILNRDLIAAGIDKIDERMGRVHLHALRHSTGTHLSKASVAPRTAQAIMRHSDIALTMNTYTDESLLNSADAVELLPSLPSCVAPNVALNPGNACRNWQGLAKNEALHQTTKTTKNPGKSLGKAGVFEVEPRRVELPASALRTQERCESGASFRLANYGESVARDGSEKLSCTKCCTSNELTSNRRDLIDFARDASLHESTIAAVLAFATGLASGTYKISEAGS